MVDAIQGMRRPAVLAVFFCWLTLAADGVFAASFDPWMPGAEQRWFTLLGTACLGLSIVLLIGLRYLWPWFMEKRSVAGTIRLLESFSKSFADYESQGLFGLDRHGRVLFVNRVACKLLSRQREDLLDRFYQDFARVEKSDGGLDSSRESLFCQSLDTGAPCRGEVQFVHEKGAVRTAEFVCMPVWQGRRVAGALVICSDNRDAKRAQSNWRQAATVFENAIEGIMILDAQANIINVNPAFTTITGYAADEVMGKNPRFMQSGRHDAFFYASMWESLQTQGQWRGEMRNQHKDGRIYAQYLSASMVRDAEGKTQQYIGIFHPVAPLQSAQKELSYLAHHDPLTELPNQGLLHDRLATAIQRARRNKTRLALLFLGLDRFKNINDSLGHAVGDKVLQEVAKRLQDGLRETDTLARPGGDAFVVLLEPIEDAQDAVVVAEKLLAKCAQDIVHERWPLSVSSSVGISLFPDHGGDPATLIGHAESAMNRAKETGPGSYVFYSQQLTEAAIEHVRLETDLRFALKRNELAICYQPQISLLDQRIIGVEVLLRWRHPTLGVLLPERFLAIAEENHSIIPIGRWVLDNACRDVAALHRAGFGPIRLGVNLSTLQLRDRAFVEDVRQVLEQTELAPGSLELEVTDRVPHTASCVRALHRLRALGVRLAIDNFGAGAASMGLLKSLPIDRLKIDRSFLREVPREKNNVAICKAVIALAHNLGVEVLAEGIETGAQLDFARDSGCDHAQGFFLGKPMSLKEFLHFVQHQAVA